MIEHGERLTGEQVMVGADVAMYDAKEASRDCLAFYERPKPLPELTPSAVAGT